MNVIVSKKISRRKLLKATIALPIASAVTFSGDGFAQTRWPSRNITMVVPFPPGGQADLAARPVAQALNTILGQPVVVENRPGVGGALGAAAVAKADPDGHTMLMTLNALVISPEADRVSGRTPLYELDQFVPVARVLSDPNIIVVQASSPWKTLKDFVEDAKRRPTEIAYSSSGNYGASHVSVEMFARAAGIKLLHVPYRGVGPALMGLIGNQVAMTSTAGGTVASQIEAGTLRVLACMGTKRLEAFPSVPTLRELGYPVEFYVWAGLFVPKLVPQPIVARLRDAVREAMRDPAVTAVFEKVGTSAEYLDAPEFTELVKSDAALLAPAVNAIGKLD